MSELLAPLAPSLRLLHALLGILLVGGLLGRWVAQAHAERVAREAQLDGVQALLSASSVFERTVIISSQLTLVLGLFTAWSQGYPLLGALQGSAANWLLVSLVISLSIAPLIPLVFIPRGRVFAAALADSVTLGRPTAGLLAAFGDPVTRAAHVYEAAAVGAVLVLMLAKPF